MTVVHYRMGCEHEWRARSGLECVRRFRAWWDLLSWAHRVMVPAMMRDDRDEASADDQRDEKWKPNEAASLDDRGRSLNRHDIIGDHGRFDMINDRKHGSAILRANLSHSLGAEQDERR
jgi:hypothetical protein